MTNSQTLGTIEATNPVLAVAPLKEETEMLRATDKITALYCRLSVEDMKEDKKGGKEDVSNSIQNHVLICEGYFLYPHLLSGFSILCTAPLQCLLRQKSNRGRRIPLPHCGCCSSHRSTPFDFRPLVFL